jgi:hypothetical protein
MTVINIQIGRLVMDGLSVSHYRYKQLIEAVEIELERLFIANGLSGRLQSDVDSSRTHESEIQMTGNAEIDSADLGQQIAKAVFEGVSR